MTASSRAAAGPSDGAQRRIPDRLTRRWPAGVGVLFAAFMVFGPGTADHVDAAPVVTASGFVYLTAAALQRRAAAWPMFFVSFVVIAIGNVVRGLPTAWPSWCMLAIASALVVYGLARGALRPAWGVPLQAVAMAVLGAAAIIAVNVAARWAGLLVGVGLLAHAAWDVYHHRVERVVARSMAEFCAVLDVLLAFVVLWVTLRG